MAEKFDSSFVEGIGFKIGPYRNGPRKYEQYLIENTRAQQESARFLHETIRNVARESLQGTADHAEAMQRAVSRSVGEAMQSSTESLSGALADIMSGQTDTMEAQNEQVVDAIDHQTNVMAEGLQRLAQGIGLGFELLGVRLDHQITLTKQIVTQLDKIHATLLAPEITRAREYHRRAENYVKNHLYQEALTAIDKSEEIETVNPSLHVLRAWILFERTEFLDVSRAEIEFQIAVRYADAIKDDLTRDLWWKIRDEANRGLGKIAFARSNDAAIDGNADEARRQLEECVRYSSQKPCSLDTRYLRAAAKAVLNAGDDAVAIIKDLTDEVPRYLADALTDAHFAGLQEKLAAIPGQLHDDQEARTSKIDRKHTRLQADFDILDRVHWATPAFLEHLDKWHIMVEQINSCISDVSVARESVLTKIEDCNHDISQALIEEREALLTYKAEKQRDCDAITVTEEPVEPEEKKIQYDREKPVLDTGAYSSAMTKELFSKDTIASVAGAGILSQLVGCVGCAIHKYDSDYYSPFAWASFWIFTVIVLIVRLSQASKEGDTAHKRELSANASNSQRHEEYLANARLSHARARDAEMLDYRSRLETYHRHVHLTEELAKCKTSLDLISTIER